MTAPSIVGSTYTQNGNGSNSTTLTVNVPTNSDGNLIFVVYVTDGDSSTASISGSGWTTLEGPQDIPASGGATAGSFYVWYKTASSDSGSYTITQSVSERAVAVAFAVSGHNGIDVEATYLSGSDSSAESNSLTTTVNDCLRISIVGSTGVRTVSTLTGHTLLATQSYTSAGTISVQYKTIATAGTDTGQTATLDSTYWCTYAFAIKPAGGTAYNQSAGGTLTPSGAVVRRASKVVAGALVPLGTVVKRAAKSLGGSLTPSGVLATSRVFLQAAAGSLTPAGALTRRAGKVVAGTLAPTGSIVRRTAKLVAGTLTPAGSITRSITKLLAGVLAPAGALVKSTVAGLFMTVAITDASVTELTLATASVTELTLSDALVSDLTMTDSTA